MIHNIFIHKEKTVFRLFSTDMYFSSFVNGINYLRNCELGKMKVLYIYNNKEVKTKEDVMSVLRLRKKSIQISEITQDEQSGLITVYVIDQ